MNILNKQCRKKNHELYFSKAEYPLNHTSRVNLKTTEAICQTSVDEVSNRPNFRIYHTCSAYYQCTNDGEDPVIPT